MVQFSIITINYNNKAGLEKTIKSVISQTDASFEYLVIDGGSIDGAVDVIKSHANKINFWCSEKDKGIYDAQNKGIAKASGAYLLFLNSGDSFHDSKVLQRVGEAIDKESHKLVYGDTDLLNEDNSITHLVPPQKLNLNFWYANTLNHQAVFAHKTLFDELGKFSLKYKYASDFDFLFKCYKKYPNEFAHVNQVICDYDNTGLTSNVNLYDLIINEREDILKTNASSDEYKSMRKAYFSTLTLKKKYQILSKQNLFLKYTLKPAYGGYKFVRNIIKGK